MRAHSGFNTLETSDEFELIFSVQISRIQSNPLKLSRSRNSQSQPSFIVSLASFSFRCSYLVFQKQKLLL